jgi:hypothetical protein
MFLQEFFFLNNKKIKKIIVNFIKKSSNFIIEK